jgi:hypothetical protein
MRDCFDYLKICVWVRLVCRFVNHHIDRSSAAVKMVVIMVALYSRVMHILQHPKVFGFFLVFCSLQPASGLLRPQLPHSTAK